MTDPLAGDRPQRRRVWRWLLGIALLAGVAVASWLASARLAGQPKEAQATARPAATAVVMRETLVNEVIVKGTLHYGPATPIAVPATGMVTWLPPIGAPVKQGQALLRVNEVPVVLLYGEIPVYRPLTVGATGRDVRQFEQNLHALGYRGFRVDDKYTTETAAAVKRWQRWMGRPASGVIVAGDVVYSPGPVRVAEHLSRVGAQTGVDVLSVTAKRKLVTVELKPDQSKWAKKNIAVQVRLPGGGKNVAGKVTEVSVREGAAAPGQPGQAGVTPTAPQAAGQSVASVAIGISDQDRLSRQGPGPVEVRYVAERRADVLTVPVAALLALAEGGYAVELSGGNGGLVPVEVGMFADARVEVRASELEPGTQIAVPS